MPATHPDSDRTSIIVFRFCPEKKQEEEPPIECRFLRDADQFVADGNTLLQRIDLTPEVQKLVDGLWLLKSCSGNSGDFGECVNELLLAVWQAGYDSNWGPTEPRHFDVTAQSVSATAYGFFRWMKLFEELDGHESRGIPEQTAYDVFRELLQIMWTKGIEYRNAR